MARGKTDVPSIAPIKEKRTVGYYVRGFLKYFVLIFFSLCAVVPLISCITTAFKTTDEYKATSVMQLPESFLNFSNFVKAFTTANMGRAFINSVIVMICVLLVSVVIGTQLAYVLNRFKFPGNGFIRTLFLVASLLPAVAMQVTVYNIMGDLRFIDHLYGYIIMSCGTDVISIYIFIQFMENISVSLDESAIVDGASYWTIYWKIILPLLKPAIVTACILKGVVIYNEYYAANLYLISPEIKTMAISLYKFVGPMGSQYNLICAGVIISIIPALIVFLCCQKQIYSGIKLSENGVLAERTMNTLLHALEAYTELYKVSKDSKVKARLEWLLDVFADKVYNPELKRQEVFFDKDYNSLIDLYSYGHDIETSWLLDRATEVLGEAEYTEKITKITDILAEQIYELAFDGHSVLTECEKGVPYTVRVWWVQAESIVGFINAYQKSGDKKYYEAAEKVWEYIKEYFIDKRPGSEWFWDLNADGSPRVGRPIVEPWKCPYHNGRMCLEIMNRLADGK